MLNRITRYLAPALMVLALIVWVWPSAPRAQTAIGTTTLSAAVTRTATSVALASDTGVSAGRYLYVDKELMVAVSEIGTTGRWNVRRGHSDGGTPAVAHASGSTVYVMASGGSGESFYTYSPVNGGACTLSDSQYQPFIDTKAGRVFNCIMNIWVESYNDPVRVADFTVRESFDQGYFIMQDDATAKSVTDNEINVVFGSPLGILTFHEEVSKTISSWVILDGVLDIDGDNDADNEGFELRQGWNPTTEGFIVAGTSGGCVTANVTIGDVSGTDQLFVGWVQNEAFNGTNTYTAYSDWSLVGLNATNGSIVSLSEVAGGGTLTDDSTVDASDGDVRTFRSCISKTGVPSAYYTTNGSGTFLSIPIVNGVTAHTAGDQMLPMFTFLSAGTDGADARLNWLEVMRLP